MESVQTREDVWRFWESRLRRVPEHLHDGLLRYLVDGVQPGGFLTAVLTNDLAKAVAAADRVSLRALPALVDFLYNEAPSMAWGSRAKLGVWVRDQRALRRMHREDRGT